MNAGEICDFCRHLWSTAGISAMTGFPITVKSSPARQCHRRTPRTSFNKRYRWTFYFTRLQKRACLPAY